MNNPSDEAASILDAAKTKKDVHENVMSALVKLETVKTEARDAQAKCRTLADAQYQYLLGYADASFEGDASSFCIDQNWKGDGAKLVSANFKREGNTDHLDVTWEESNAQKFRFSGNVVGWAAKGKIEKWQVPYMGLTSILGGTQEGKFESYADGYFYLSREIDKFTIFIQESNSGHRSLSFSRANP